MSPIEIRFWAKVRKVPGCWLWQGNCFTQKRGGYGAFSLTHTKKVYAHRTAWEFYNGKIPAGLCVLHRCDTPKCVRPSHLFLGTRTDNSIDKVKKGRQPRGQQLPQAKLTPAKVRALRRLRRTRGITYETLGLAFGISQSHACRVVNRKEWSHIA